MIKFNYPALLFGITLASIDVVMMFIIKGYSTGWLKSLKWMIIPTIIYALNPWIFMESLNFESLTVMNLTWDLLSDILVTAMGLFVLKETIPPMKLIGVGLAMVSLVFLMYENGD
jgi:multidrug transporter EmrE-like cation transporter